MKRTLFPLGTLALITALALAPGCSDDSTGPGPQPPTNVPEIPIPGSPTEVLPITSGVLAVGLSNPVGLFVPMVTRLQMMQDDGSEPWLEMNRHLVLACGDVLPEYSCNMSTTNRCYIDAPPRLLHERYWRKVKQVTLEPGSSYSQSETISYGTSTSHEESREFSRTVGVEVEAGGSWGAFSASVKASYEQTDTRAEVNSVTFSTEETKSETYTVESDPNHTRLYALWQLVDRFSLVDANSVRIHSSPTLRHAQIPAIAGIEFPNRDVIYQSVTTFD